MSEWNSPESSAAGTQLLRNVVSRVEAQFRSWNIYEDSGPNGGRAAVAQQLTRLNELQEHFYEVYSTLSVYKLPQHHMLWAHMLNALATRLLQAKEYYAEHTRGHVQGPDTVAATTAATATVADIARESSFKLSKLTSDLSQLTRVFFGDELDLNRLWACGAAVMDQTFSLSVSSLKLLMVDIDEPQLPGGGNDEVSFGYSVASLASVIAFVERFHKVIVSSSASTSSASPAALSAKTGVFPTLVEALKCAYHIDQTALLAPLVAAEIVTPMAPLGLVRHASIDFAEVVDYYRFAAFATSASGDALEAEIYFKALLSFPNLNVRIWTDAAAPTQAPAGGHGFGSDALAAVMEEDASHSWPSEEGDAAQEPPTGHLSLADRQEIALLFVINHLLKLSSMAELVNPSAAFSSELRFLIRTLSATMSVDIHKTASVSSLSVSSLYQDRESRKSSCGSSASRSSSMTGYRGLPFTTVTCRSISDILHHGTYKEKLGSIIQFFELFTRDTLNVRAMVSGFQLHEGNDVATESEFDRLVAHMDVARFPGKLKYACTISKLAATVRSVATIHWVSSMGLRDVPESLIRHKFAWHGPITQDAILQNWRHIRVHDNAEGAVLSFEPKQDVKPSFDSRISKSLAIHKLTAQLDLVDALLR
ncbi:PCI domain-containing protein [[Candida] zeylanoides]